ncbi:transposase [Leucobacter sp. OH1287]|uniref:transposase n=1 Tax=Leucobacter sp. OH1287 TaxID=2491049 RepID=UPI001F1FB6DA|nr:transposase [Leucobacter sp. OH1287]
MATRKRHTVTAIVRLLERDAELTAQGLSTEEVARQLEISTSTLHNWRNRFGQMSTSEAEEYVEMKDEIQRLKRIVADQVLEIDALKLIAKGKF